MDTNRTTPPQGGADEADPSGSEAAIVALADSIMAGHAESNRLCDEEDNTASRAKKAQIRERISNLSRDGWDMLAELATTPATTPAGLRAKARIVREYNNCTDGADPYDNDAMAWSLANDLLGIESRFMTEAERDALPEPPPPPTFREQYPPYQRTPDDLAAWLAEAEEDFAAYGLIPGIQAREAPDVLTVTGASLEELDALYERLKAVDDRWEARRNALRGALLQVGVARIRAREPELGATS